MLLTDFKILTFGCYGTLIDRESGIIGALRPLLTNGNVRLSREQVLATFVEHESLQQAETPGMPYSSVLAEVHRRLARVWSVTSSADDHALFGKSVPNWPVFADTPAALQYLKRFFKLAILSNVDRNNFAGSSRRLAVTFDAVITAQEIGTYKPDLRNFEYMVTTLAKLGLARHEVLHTAESLVRDHAPAASCRLASAWIDRRQDKKEQQAASSGARWDFRFSSLVDMVRAHQEQLRA